MKRIAGITVIFGSGLLIKTYSMKSQFFFDDNKLLDDSSNNDNFTNNIRQLLLGKHNKLSMEDYDQISQKISYKEAIQLANYIPNIDTRVFPSSSFPSQLLSESLLDSLFSITFTLDNSLKGNTFDYLKKIMYLADDEIVRDTDIRKEFYQDSQYLYAILQKMISQELLITICLRIILSLENFSNISQRLLPLLSQLVSQYSESPTITNLIGQILAIIALESENHEALFHGGWLKTLVEMKQNPNLLVHVPAIKALSNMNQIESREIYSKNVYLLTTPVEDVSPTCDIIFIHGLLGGIFYSWRQADENNSQGKSSITELISNDEYSFCWPKDWLSSDCHTIRILGVDYDTSLSQWTQSTSTDSLLKRSQDLLSQLKMAGVGKRPIIFVGHSLGGLIIKQILLLLTSKELECVKGIVFYGTPHKGSKLVQIGSLLRYLLYPSTEVHELNPDSSILNHLHVEFTKLINQNKFIHVISFGESESKILGLNVDYVDLESSNPNIGEFYHVKADHMNICKPENKNSIQYIKLIELIHSVCQL